MIYIHILIKLAIPRLREVNAAVGQAKRRLRCGVHRRQLRRFCKAQPGTRWQHAPTRKMVTGAGAP